MTVLPASSFGVSWGVLVFFVVPILIAFAPQRIQRRSWGAWVAFVLALAFAVTGICGTFVGWLAWECWVY